jgi:plasmid maintenance system antidote protein VapI
LAEAAQNEDTFSGELRRRIHRGGMPITQIAKRSGISLTELDEFITGERTLSSSVIDQLVEILGCKLVPVEEVK